jgi:hypothetical protein
VAMIRYHPHSGAYPRPKKAKLVLIESFCRCKKIG